MLYSVLFLVVIRLEARVGLLQIPEADNTARVVGSHCGTAQTLAQNAVAGAQGLGVVDCVEDGALCLGRC
jgi:hypothetical protein